MNEARSKASKRACLLIPLPQLVWEVKNHAYLDTNTRKRWSTASHLFVAPIKITKWYKREHIHFVSVPCGEHSCCYKLRAKNTAAILHIFERCVPYSKVRCVARFDILFLCCGLFLIALSYLIRCARGKRPNQSRQRPLLLTSCIPF